MNRIIYILWVSSQYMKRILCILWVSGQYINRILIYIVGFMSIHV